MESKSPLRYNYKKGGVYPAFLLLKSNNWRLEGNSILYYIIFYLKIHYKYILGVVNTLLQLKIYKFKFYIIYKYLLNISFKLCNCFLIYSALSFSFKS